MKIEYFAVIGLDSDRKVNFACFDILGVPPSVEMPQSNFIVSPIFQFEHEAEEWLYEHPQYGAEIKRFVESGEYRKALKFINRDNK